MSDPTPEAPGGGPAAGGPPPPGDDPRADAPAPDPSSEPGLDDELVDLVEGEGDPSADPPPAEVLDVATAVAERDHYLALARQVQADFENFRKRTQSQQGDVEARAGARIVEGLLPVLDACDNALIHGVEGVTPVYKALFEALTRSGLGVIAAEGHPFDPHLHDAVVHEPGEGGEPVVVEALRTGYTWHGRVLRAAMVKVRD